MIQRDINQMLEVDKRVVLLINQDFDKAVNYTASIYGMDKQDATEILNKYIMAKSQEL